ncbi:hypothetical protein Tco_1159164 [Tanacetum coccineum]
MRKDLKLGNAMEDSILERSKESPHFKSFWMLLLSLYATQHFLSLQMFQKSTCINSGILFTSMTLFTDSRWTKGRDSNLIWKSSEISSRSALKCINPGELFAALINRSLYGKTTGLDKLRLSKAQIFWGMYHQKNVDYVELLWEEFIYQIENKAYKKQVKMYYPRFSKVIIHYFITQDKTLSWRNKIRMHTSRDDYLINTLRFVSIKEETQIYGAILPNSLTSPEMKETKAYKTYLVSTEEPMRKSKRVKRPAKKINKASTRGVVIRETPKIPMSKKKEKKSMRDFHKTRPSRSGTVTKTAPTGSWGNDGDDRNNEQESSGEDSDQKNESDDDKTQSDNKNESNSEHETDENESSSESDQDKNEDDEEEVKDKLVKTPSNDFDDENETKFTDKAEGDEDEEMDYTTSQLYDDVDIRLNEPVDSDKGFVPEEGTDAAMTNVQKGDENPEILQVIEDAHVTLSTVPQKTELQVTTLEKEVTELKKDPLHTQVIALVDDHLDTRLGATRDEFMNFFLASLTARITEQVKNQLPQILPEEDSSQPQSSYEAAATLIEFELKKIMIDKIDKSESYLAAPEHRECYEGLKKSYDLDKTIFSTYGKVYSLKRSRKDKDEDPSAGSDRGLKKRKTGKDATPATEEPEFEVADSDMLQDQEENLGKDDEEHKEKVASKHDWFTKPTQPQEPTDPD